MKILLHREAQTISDRELEKNQQYLIKLFEKIYNLPIYLNSYFRHLFTKNYRDNNKKKNNSI